VGIHLAPSRPRDTAGAMSQENVEIVGRLYEFFARRDVEPAFPDYAAQDIELRVPPLYPDTPSVFRGRAGIEEWIAMVDEVWTEWRFEPERYLDAGSTVVVLARLIGEARASGVHLEREVAHVWTLEEGRATGIRAYLDRDEALEAAGLEE
jgi:uncharacterized protein